MSADAPALAIVVLTLDAQELLPACLDSVSGLDAEIFVVDSGSRDRTVEIARERGCRLVEHEFASYGEQRNWAFDNLPIRSPWTLCLDADERLTPRLAAEIAAIAGADARGPDGYMMKRRTEFMGRWIRHGGQYPAWHLRLTRTGRGRCEERLYDQHFVVEGEAGRLEGDLVDVLAADLATWSARHVRWADLEARELLRAERGIRSDGPRVAERADGDPIERRRYLRHRVYYRAPPYLRAFALFAWAYFVRLGFLDGVPGLVFHTLHKLWFRFLVDARLGELRRASDAARAGVADERRAR